MVRAIGYWMLMLVGMIANGAVRQGLLIPAVGERAGQAISALTGITIILSVGYLFVRSLSSPEARFLARVAVLWFVLTVAFEFLFGHYVAGDSWSALIANYDVSRGRLWPFVLLSVPAGPLLWGAQFRRKRRRRPSTSH